MEVKLAKAEVKGLCHYAKTAALDLASRSTQSDWTLPGHQPIADKRREDEEHQSREKVAELNQVRRRDQADLIDALDVFGVLSVALGVLNRGEEWTKGIDVIHVEFSDDASSWLMEHRRELRADLDDRRASSEIFGGTRNETFVLFVLDTIAGQLAGTAAPELKAAA